MANDPDMAEAISDIYSDCEKRAESEAADFAAGRLASDDPPTKDDADLLKRWRTYKANERVYVPSRSMELFHMSEHKLRIIHGPVGSGKSYGVTMDVPMRCARQSPCEDGVIRNRALFARNIYQQLKQTTFDMWMKAFPTTKIALSSPIQGSLRLKLGNRSMLIELIGLGTDTQSAEATLRSNGFSIARVEEVQYISYRMLCLMQERLGRYPDMLMAPEGKKVEGYFKNLGLSGDTNMPVEGSWLYERAQVIKDPDEYYLFQPPAMFRTWNPVTKRWIYEENRGQRAGVDAAENVENLLEGWEYYWTQIRVKTDDDIRRNVLNEYGHILSGTPVYPEFSKTLHVPATGVPLPPRGVRIYCGMDLGRNPRAVFAYHDTRNGGVRVFRILSKDCGVKMFAETVMRPNLMMWGISPATVTVIPDPAGENRGEQIEATSVEILRAAGFDVAMPVLKNNDPFTRVETVKQALTSNARDGDPYVTFDPSCEELIRSLAGGHTYATIKTGNGQEHVSEKPGKGPYSHVANALEYLLVGMKYGRREDRVFGGAGASAFAERLAAAMDGRDMGLRC